MPKNTKTIFKEICFDNQRLAPIGIELMSLDELFSRNLPRNFFEPEKVKFFMVLVIRSGSGYHLVDFERVPLKYGDVIFVQPGQIQQWEKRKNIVADLLLIDPAMIQSPQRVPFSESSQRSLLNLKEWPSAFKIDAAEMERWQSLSAMLREELAASQLNELSAAIARELLLCLMLNLNRAATRNIDQLNPQVLLVRRFQQLVETLVNERPSVAQCAQLLNVSTSTLTRISNEVLGHPAKEEIDRRIALEAQRLLVHSMAASAKIGEELGFSEATNFVKFFRRILGMTPDAFRRSHRMKQ